MRDCGGMAALWGSYGEMAGATELYCDRRLGGLERWYLSRPQDYMVIPDEIRKCVCFVGLEKAGGEKVLFGTAYFMGRPLENLIDRWFCYVVTAKHVIEAIRDKGVDSVWLRLNLRGSGAAWVKTDLSAWNYHPSDPSVDVAAASFSITDQVDHKYIPIGMCATRAVIGQEKIDVGDELFLTGLFVQHVGRKRNIPIVRVGNIAAMPHEKVSTRMGDIDAYLIEARSIGGLSGSPVFVNLSGVRHGNLSLVGSKFFLLGLMHGHFDSEISKKSVDEVPLAAETVNMGIGVVVPIEKVVETINQPNFRLAEDRIEKLERERGMPKMD
jgi:hypothetical protein